MDKFCPLPQYWLLLLPLLWSLYEIIHICTAVVDESEEWSSQYKCELFHINFTLFHRTGRYELNKLTRLAPNVWLHSPVGRASHRYRGGHGFESRWSLDFFRLLLSNCLNWEIYCDDHSSLWHWGFKNYHAKCSFWRVTLGIYPQT